MTDYVELHCHSNYSLLDGASHVDALVSRAHTLGMTSLALTDHDALYGAVRFVKAAQAHGIHPILGAELTLASGHHLTLLVENEQGWRNLCTLISIARHHAAKGEALLPVAMLPDYTQGLIALSGCRHGEIASAIRQGDFITAREAAHRYVDWFGPDRFWIELQNHLLPDSLSLTRQLVAFARRLSLGYVATNNVHYAEPDGHRLQDVLTCIRHRTTLDEAAALRRPNAEYYLKSGAEMARLFAEFPDALSNTRQIAEQCQFELTYGLQDLPVFPTRKGESAIRELRRLCVDTLPARYAGTPSTVWTRLLYELDVIERCGLANYFLIVGDIVRFAMENGIRCQGRGSAANSLVAYLLGITRIDPLAHNLVFERFLSDERRIVPDIDIDFQADRREEVIQYVYSRYGTDHAAMACTVVTFQARSAVRDVGKALGLPPDELEDLSRYFEMRDHDLLHETPADSAPSAQFAMPVMQQLIDLCRQIDDFPRHLSIHNGGMVITAGPISERVPTEPATMPGRVVVQWDKDSLEEAGLIKIDLLGLRMLSAVQETVQSLAATGIHVDLDRLPFDDPAIYAMMERADTIGVFQVESRAQAQVLPRLKPRCFEDVIVSISLIRPGPVQGEMVHPYLARRSGEAEVVYADEKLRPVLQDTLGILLFQEQVLTVAKAIAGFTPGQGEMLRRALGSKRATAEIEKLESAFLEGAQAQGVTLETAERIFGQLKGFGGYSFPKSHAAAFAVLVYQSAWLRWYFPAHFYVALLNNQPMGFWTPAILVNDARHRGIRVLSVDINASDVRCRVEGDAIRLGLTYINRIGDRAALRVERARRDGPFTSLHDFCRRTGLAKRLVENLIMAGAMDGWGMPRRKLLWQLGLAEQEPGELDLQFRYDDVTLPTLSPADALRAEVEILGLSTGDHPMALYRDRLSRQGVLSSCAFNEAHDDEQVRVAGMIVVHQSPPTAKGFHFITLEDEHGLMNVIVRPKIYSRFRRVIRSHAHLIVDGIVQRRDGVINLIAQTVRPVAHTFSHNYDAH